MSTRIYKVIVTGLSLLSVTLLVLLAHAYLQFSSLKGEIRYANDITMRFDDERYMASKGTATEAADILWRLHFPSFEWQGKPEPFRNALWRIVERHRRAAVRGVISNLRTKTAEDLGDDPEPWIRKYGSEDSIDGLAVIKEEAPGS